MFLEFLCLHIFYHELAPQYLLMCSKDTQKVRDQGAILTQQGTNPL